MIAYPAHWYGTRIPAVQAFFKMKEIECILVDDHFFMESFFIHSGIPPNSLKQVVQVAENFDLTKQGGLNTRLHFKDPEFSLNALGCELDAI